MGVPPNNRQLKLLRLLGIPFVNLSGDDVRHTIQTAWHDPATQELWNKYVYLTHDLTSSSPELQSFDPNTLDGVVLPKGWTASVAEREYREQAAGRILKNAKPLDAVPPPVAFDGCVFCFTGRFKLGTRLQCEQAVIERGGLIHSSGLVTHVVDFLVIGSCGSERWKQGAYGAKIEAAVVERSIHRKPAIISEEHWHSSL